MLPETVREAARRFGRTPVLVAPDGRELTYAELDRRSDEVAAGLVAHHVEPGDIVALVLASSIEYALAYVAAAKVGAVTAGVNPVLAQPEQAALLELVAPALVVRHPGDVDGLAVPGAAPPPLPDDPGRPVAIVFTSGTTGIPKGAVFANRQLSALATAEVGDAWGGGRPSHAATPFPHVGFMCRFPWQIRAGGTMHLMERFRAAEALRLVVEHRMPSVGGISAQIALMLLEPDFDDLDLSCVETVVLGGGPAPAGLRREAAERFGARVSVRFSLTESGGIGTATAFDAPEDEALHSIGRPRGPVEVGLRDPGGRDVPAGEVGEICLRTPTAMEGYWADPEATRAAFWPDRFLRTGDLGWLGDDGCVRLAGRSKEMYVRGGYNVYPQEVENVLSQHPGVAAVAVVPRTDPVMGEVGVAVVVARDPVNPPTLDDLRVFAGDHVARHKLPEDLALVDALPMTHIQKVDRATLAALVGDRSRAEVSRPVQP